MSNNYLLNTSQQPDHSPNNDIYNERQDESPEPDHLRVPGPDSSLIATVPGRPRYERITDWLTYLVDPGTVVELRAPEVDFGNGFKATVSGFYDSAHLL